MNRLLLFVLLSSSAAWADPPVEAPAVASVKAAKGPDVDALVAKVTGSWRPRLGEIERKQVDLVRLVTGDIPVTDARLAELGLDEAQLREARLLRDEMANNEASRRQARMALQALDGLTIAISKDTMSLSGMGETETVSWIVERVEGEVLHIVVTKANGSQEPSRIEIQPDGTLKVFEQGLEKLHLERR